MNEHIGASEELKTIIYFEKRNKKKKKKKELKTFKMNLKHKNILIVHISIKCS